MIILTLVDGYEEIFETFHLLKSCRSTTRYHSVLVLILLSENTHTVCGGC